MHFLELPRELRDAIYTFALCPRGVRGDVKIKHPTTYRGESDENQKLALFAVCRQIHSEALPLYYSRNVFYLGCSDYLRHLVRPHNAEHIRAISLGLIPKTASHYTNFTSALARLPQLEHLELRTTRYRFLNDLTYRVNDHDSLEQRLECSRDTQWLMRMSGLSYFRIKWINDCLSPGHPVADPSLRDNVEACLRSEVTQPRAPYGKSPTHLARMAAQSSAQQRSRSLVQRSRIFKSECR